MNIIETLGLGVSEREHNIVTAAVEGERMRIVEALQCAAFGFQSDEMVHAWAVLIGAASGIASGAPSISFNLVRYG